MRNRRLQVLGILGILAAIVAVCLAVPGPGPRPEKLNLKPASLPKAPPKRHLPTLPFKLKNGKATLGNPKAKVQLTLFIPGLKGCGNYGASFVYDVAKANPSKLGVTVVDFESPEGHKLQSSAHISCAGLVIDGKQQIKVTDESGKERTLNFHSNLGDAYKESDVYLALDQAFGQAYGLKCNRPTKATSTPRPPGDKATDQQAKPGAKAG